VAAAKVTPTREAITLPLIFLSVVLAGSVNVGPSLSFAPPPLFALILAVMLVACLVQSRALSPGAIIHARRPALANLNGLAVLLTLFAASAQVVSVVMPATGVPAILMGILLFALLAQALAIGASRERMLRGLLVSLGVAFALKFIVLTALSAPAASRTGRAVQLLFEGVTLGTVTQPAMHPASGYIAFATIMLYLFGLVLLPRGEASPWMARDLIDDRSSESLQRR
jgi:hypothetical protein